MREKDLTDSFAKGFQSTQAGGALGSDSAERLVKGVFNKVVGGASPKKEKPATQKTNTVIQKTKAEPVKPVELPLGVSNGKYVQIRKDDVISYKSDNGEGEGKVLKVAADSQIQIKQSNNNLVVIKSKDIKQLNGQDWKLREQTLKDNKMKKVNEGLAELAGVAEKDHEVQMARADLYKIAKYAIKLHDMLKGVSETEGLEGWQQAKITKAADYISSVYHNLDYATKFGEQQVAESDDGEFKRAHDAGYRDAAQGKKKNSYNPGSPLATQYDKGQEAYKRHFGESTDPYKKKLAEKLAKKIA
jgi:hypothetical protein